MAIARVQSNAVTTGTNADPQSATFTSTTTTGNLLVAIIHAQVSTVVGITDNKSNTWSLFRSLVNYNGSWSQYIYYSANATGGATHTLTIDMSSSGWPMYVGLHEFSGAATSNPIESATATASITSNASSSSPTNGAAITTTTANDYVVGIFDATTSTTFSAASGWALLTTGTATITSASVGQLGTSAGSYTPQVLSAITGWSMKAWSMAIKPAAGATFIAAKPIMVQQALNRASNF